MLQRERERELFRARMKGIYQVASKAIRHVALTTFSNLIAVPHRTCAYCNQLRLTARYWQQHRQESWQQVMRELVRSLR